MIAELFPELWTGLFVSWDAGVGVCRVCFIFLVFLSLQIEECFDYP